MKNNILKSKIKNINNQKGFSLLIALLVMAVVLVISLAISTLIITEVKLVGTYDDAIIAYYAADAGIEDALLKIINRESLNASGNVYLDSPTNKIFYNYPKPTTSTIVIPGILNQDESVEVSSSENSSPTQINISWNSNPPGTDEASLEWTLIPYTKDPITNYPEKIGKGFYNSKTGVYNDNDIEQDYFSVTQPSPQSGYMHGITINITNIDNKKVYFKLRVKCLAKADSGTYQPGKFKISYRISSLSSGEITTGAYKISSTGTVNNVKRKIEVQTDPGRHGIIGVFDYVLYSEEPLYKPSK